MEDEIAGMVVKLAMEDGSFQDSINNINRQMKVVDSEFKSATGGAKDFGNSIDGLEANITRLNQVTQLQSQLVGMYEQRLMKSKHTLDQNVAVQEKLVTKIEQAKKEYEEIADTLGRNSKEAKALKEELDKLEKQYENNNQKIRNNVRQIDNHTIALNNNKTKLKQMESQLKDAEGAMEKLGKATNESSRAGISGIDIMNISMGNLLSEGIQLAIEGIKELGEYALEYAQQMKQLSDMTGFSTDSLQQWDTILKQTGGDIDTLAGSLMDFNERIFDASSGSGEAFEVFNELGVAVANADGSLRSTEEVFNDTIFALQNMEDQTKKAAYSTILLSTGGEELATVLNMTNEQLIATKESVNIVSEDDLNAINSFNLVLKDFCDGTAKELMGILADVATLLTPILVLLDYILQPILKITHSITDVIAEPFRQLTETTEDTNKNIVKSYDEAGKEVVNMQKDNYSTIEGMAQEHNSVMTELSKVSMDSMNKELSEYEQKLKETYDASTRSGREAIRKRLEHKEKELQESYRLEEEHYKKVAELQARIQSKRVSNNTNIPGYAKGTKYHPGGLAIVGENGPELINLNRGAKVYTNNHTQQILNNSSSNQGPTYNLSNFTIQANSAEDLFNQIQILTRRGALT